MKLIRPLAAAAVALTIGVATSPGIAQKSHINNINQQLSTLTQVVRELNDAYVDTLRTEKMVRAGLDAMLATLDPYTVYYSDAETESFKESTSGEYGGIGIRIVRYGSQPYFTSPMKGLPADRAGLRSGDRIVKVDTTSTVGRDNQFVTSLLRGEPGTQVSVQVIRPYVEDSVINVNIIREKLNVPAITLARLDSDGIGYIALSTFSENAAKEVAAELEKFKSSGNLKGVVIDLTDNGGGLLTQAVEIAGMFVPKGTQIVTTKGRSGEARRIYRTPHTPILPDTPLAILINRGSASASEVLAGAIQDLDRGVLVGERSFGKGLVQSTRELPQGLLKYTTAKYYIPSGRLIQAIDYSHRTADGKAQNVPDSLTHEFLTAKGRKVRDGGGLRPDVEVKDSTISLLAYKLWEGPWLFNYANRYAATHPEIAAPEEFALAEGDFKDFADGLQKNNFKYTSTAASQISALRDVAKQEGYLTQEADSLLKSLETELTPRLESDLAKNREQIETILVPMIVERYYYDPGAALSALQWNREFAEARKLLLDDKRYNDILNTKAPAKKSKK